MVDDLKPATKPVSTQTDPLEYIEVLRDRRAINERFAELQKAVKKEILVFTKPPYATPPQENVEGLEVTRNHAAARSTSSRSSMTRAVATGVQRFVEAGEEARFVARAAAQARHHRRDDRDVRHGGPDRRSSTS